MKKLTLLTLIALSLGFFQACKSGKAGNGSDSTAANADSAKMTSDSSKKDSSAMSAGSDTGFTTKAAVGGMAEVALGKLALSKTSNAKIKDFANMMVMDHGKANNELMGIAKNKNITLPATVDAEHQAKMDSLSKLSGKDFDAAYVNAMVEGHEKTLALMQGEAQNGTDADLKGFATKTAPVVQMHLNAINKIKASMK
jgi:putative membrane protein